MLNVVLIQFIDVLNIEFDRNHTRNLDAVGCRPNEWTRQN
jgi:hypothetical protein